jgi:outer membrane protein assembly factor BamB
VDISSGEILWRRELSAHAGVAADASSLYITDSSDQIWGAEPSDGAGRWRQEGLKHRRVTAPALAGDLIVVGDLDGFVHVLARADGRFVGRARIKGKGAINARPLVSAGRVVVYSDEGVLEALRIGGATLPAARNTGPSAGTGGGPNAPIGGAGSAATAPSAPAEPTRSAP